MQKEYCNAGVIISLQFLFSSQKSQFSNLFQEPCYRAHHNTKKISRIPIANLIFKKYLPHRIPHISLHRIEEVLRTRKDIKKTSSANRVVQTPNLYQTQQLKLLGKWVNEFRFGSIFFQLVIKPLVRLKEFIYLRLLNKNQTDLILCPDLQKFIHNFIDYTMMGPYIIG